MDLFRFAEEIPKEAQGLRIAHVLPAHDLSSKDIRFLSTVQVNRGVSSQEFTSIEEAENWLTGKS
jgi:hypothetical protein